MTGINVRVTSDAHFVIHPAPVVNKPHLPSGGIWLAKITALIDNLHAALNRRLHVACIYNGVGGSVNRRAGLDGRIQRQESLTEEAYQKLKAFVLRSEIYPRQKITIEDLAKPLGIAAPLFAKP